MVRGCRRRGAVIFLHGSGDTGLGVREWLESASRGKFERTLAELGLGSVVYPTALERRYTLAGGMPSTVWFDRERLSPGSPQDRGGVIRSLRQVEDEVRKLEDEGVPSSGVFVGGFSMGGSLALEALGNEALAARLAGVFCHASFLNDDSAVFEVPTVTPAPVYASHGVADSLVNVAWGRSTAERLKGRGFDLSFTEHGGMDHELGEKQIEGLLDWISAVVARPGFGQPASAGEDGDERIPSPMNGGGVMAAGAASSGGAVHPSQEPACSVPYEVTELGQWQCRASFEVPPGSEELLSGANICARGAFFQLETVAARPGRVVTSFMSPKPEVTAAAIARRIEQRLGDPRPPGVEEACCLS